MRLVAIYALLDGKGSVRWIGKSHALAHRLSAHRREKPWFMAAEILEFATQATWSERERAWIAKAKQFNWPLENKASGGQGSSGFKMKADQVARLAAALKGRPLSTAHCASLRNGWLKRRAKGLAHPSIETRAKLAAVHKGKKRSAEHRAAIARGKLGKPLSQSHIAALKNGWSKRRERLATKGIECHTL